MNEQHKCELCGEPMPPGEQMFKFHGYSGPCPAPQILRKRSIQESVAEAERLLDETLMRIGPNDETIDVAWVLTRITKIREALADRPKK